MSKHPFRKAIGLSILYSIIIIGIFVLQFRNESVILRNIGILRMSVAQTQNSEGETSLKNTVQVSFKGISFTADDVHPAAISTYTSAKRKPLTLLSWEQPSPLSYKFNFTNNTSIIFTVSDTTSKASLSVTAMLPPDAKNLYLYYKPVSGYSVTEQSKTRQLFNSKNISYTMSAQRIADTEIIFSREGNVAMYTRYDPSKTFTFASIPSDSETAKLSRYEETVKKYRSTLVASVTEALADTSTISETAVAAYVAELSSQGKYQEALAAVPDSFKKGTRRSYFTSPYFNSLVSMNSSLIMASENYASMVQNAIARNSLDIFNVNNIADFMLRSSNKEAIAKLVAIPSSAVDFQPTLSQATGILRTYNVLTKASSEYAAALTPVIDTCLNVITTSCTISSDNLILQEKDTPVSFMQAVDTGTALIDYGTAVSNQDYKNGGYMIVNTAFAQNVSLDVRTMADVYSMIVTNNPAYPHSLVAYTKNPAPVWAWTCASNITYEETPDGMEATIVVSFKQGDTHYIILNGIKPFSGIEIYGLSFHTDPRFETYNSSGYVYNEKTRTLFLKSRHKVSNEKIRLYFRKPAAETPAAAKPAVSEEKPSAPATETAAAPAPAPEPAGEQTDTSDSE